LGAFVLNRFSFFFFLMPRGWTDTHPLLDPTLPHNNNNDSDGAANAPSLVGVCQPVGGAVEAVAACYWRLVPGKKGAPKYHIDF
jgi:hypothetical protein